LNRHPRVIQAAVDVFEGFSGEGDRMRAKAVERAANENYVGRTRPAA